MKRDTDLPRWVWDLVISLQGDENEHGPLWLQHFDGQYVRSDWCPGRALERVPEVVRDCAAILADLLPPPDSTSALPRPGSSADRPTASE